MVSAVDSRGSLRSGVTGYAVFVAMLLCMLFCAGGVGIFQLSWDVSFWLGSSVESRLENIDRARWPVLLRNSVRPEACIGMGSEICGLKTVDELVEFLLSGFLCLPVAMTQSSIKRTPTRMPTPIPPAKMPVGNLLPSFVALALEPEAMTVEVVEEDEGGEVADLEAVAAAMEEELAVEALEAVDDAGDREEVLSFPDLLELRIRLQTELSSLFEAMQL